MEDFPNKDLIDKFIKNIIRFQKEEKDKIASAAVYAAKKHGDQKRKSGEPYIIHPLAVAETLMNIGMDADTAKNAYICFETYNNTDSSVNLTFVYRTPTSLLLATNNNCAPHAWTSYEFCVADLLAIDNGFLTAMGNFQISYNANYEGDKEYFFDNFRVEIRD